MTPANGQNPIGGSDDRRENAGRGNQSNATGEAPRPRPIHEAGAADARVDQVNILDASATRSEPKAPREEREVGEAVRAEQSPRAR